MKSKKEMYQEEEKVKMEVFDAELITAGNQPCVKDSNRMLKNITEYMDRLPETVQTVW